MKRNSVLIILLWVCITATAQDNIIGKIVYDYAFVQDLENPKNLYTDKLVLQFGKTSSIFRSQLLIETTELEKKRMQDVIKNSNNKTTIVDKDPSLMRGSPNIYYNFYNTKMNFQYSPLNGTKFLIKEPLENIDWKILNEVKGIGGYGCQKAIGKSHGRVYIAWFCTDIPYPFGPRKLWGLPGIILEAHDTENHIMYKLNMVDLKPTSEKIQAPTDVVITTSKEYSKFQKAISQGAVINNTSSYGDVKVSEETNVPVNTKAGLKQLNSIDRD